MKKIFYGWWVVAGAFVLLFCAVGSQFYAFPVFFQAMLEDMQWTRAQTAGALSLGIFVIGIIGPLVGILISKIGLRKVIVSGSLLATLGYYLLSTVTNLTQFYIFYGLILCTGIGFITLVSNLTAVESWFIEKRSTALGIATMGIGAGGAVMAPLSSRLISTYGWQNTFLFLGILVGVVGVIIGSIVMRSPEEKGTSPLGWQGATSTEGILSETGLSLKEASKTRAFWCISIAVMLWGWAYSSGLVHQVAFAVDIGIDRAAAAGAVGLLTAFSIPGRLIFGRLGDLIDKRYVFSIGVSLQIIAFLVLLKTSNLHMLYLYSILIGLNIGGLAPILPGIIADHFGRKHFGIIYGAAHFMQTIGIMLGPLFTGWVFDTIGNYSTAYITAAGFSLLAIITINLAGKPHPQVK